MMKHRKQALALLLAALLCLTGPAAKAEEPSIVPLGTMLYDRAEQLCGAAVVDGSLYMLGYTTLLRWRPGEAKVQELQATEPFVVNPAELLNPMLLSDGRELWRLEPSSGRLQRLVVTENSYRAEKPIQLDWRSFTEDHARPKRAAVLDGALWLIRELGDGSTRLMRVKLQQGAKLTALKVRNLQVLAPAGDGSLLALQHDAAGNSRRQGSSKQPLPVTIGRYDPKADRFTPGQELDLGPYPNLDAATLLSAGDAFYVAAGDRLWRVDAKGRQEACAALPGLNFINAAGQALWPIGDRLCLVGQEQVLLRSGDPTAFQAARRLVISTEFLTSQRESERLALAMGNAALLYNPDQAERSQEELAGAFLLNEVRSDVLVMEDHSFDLAALGRKGYLLDLQGSDVLRAYVEGLDPKLQPLVWQEGQLVMIPFRISLLAPTAHAEALRTLGLGVPRDFFELCALVEGYARPEVQRQAPPALLGAENYRDALIRLGVELWFQEAHARGKELRFDDPLFRRMIQHAQQLNLSALEQARTGGEDYPLMTLGSSLEGTPFTYQEGSYTRAFDHITLVTELGRSPAVPASFLMLAVNSRTAMPELAIRFLEEASRLSSPGSQALMRPGFQGAIPNPDYAHDVAATRQRILMYEAEALSARNQRTRESYEQEAAAERRRLDDAEQELKYLESAENVALARAIANQLLPQTSLMVDQRLALAQQDLVGQLAKGVLGLDQFIQQADSKLRLVELEHR